MLDCWYFIYAYIPVICTSFDVVLCVLPVVCVWLCILFLVLWVVLHIVGSARLHMWTLVQFGTRRDPYRTPTRTTTPPTPAPWFRQPGRPQRRNNRRNRPAQRPATPDWESLSDQHIIQVPPCKRPILTHLGYADSKYPRNNLTGHFLPQGPASNKGQPCRRPALEADTGTTPSGKHHKIVLYLVFPGWCSCLIA